TPWRTFRYSDAAVSLVLSSQTTGIDRAAEVIADQAHLTTYLGTDGTVEHHFGFRLTNWTQRTLPVRLPVGARPLALQVDGYWVTLPGTNQNEDSNILELPVPKQAGAEASDSPHRFEIVYATDASAGGIVWPWTRVEATTPELPTVPLTFHRV